jgi:CBS domain-containing protein
MQDGKDSFPVFYMSPQSTLAAAMAKLVATRSHRMWITDADAPMPPSPATPGASLHHPAFLGSAIHGPPYTSTGSAISAASLPGQITSGRLVGVISLTDVLNLFARASGINTSRPDEARSRRRSSSSSLRGSMDSSRASLSGIAGPRNG